MNHIPREDLKQREEEEDILDGKEKR